jgi:hypothetical protein
MHLKKVTLKQHYSKLSNTDIKKRFTFFIIHFQQSLLLQSERQQFLQMPYPTDNKMTGNALKKKKSIMTKKKSLLF